MNQLPIRRVANEKCTRYLLLFRRHNCMIKYVQNFLIGIFPFCLFNASNFFNFYVITGGMPKYLDVSLNENAKNIDDLLKIIFQKDSLFLIEGKNLLIEELGRDYLTYFTILELISQGKTGRGEIESLLEKDIGGYLQRLENDYTINLSLTYFMSILYP